jgi:hypothetical protein
MGATFRRLRGISLPHGSPGDTAKAKARARPDSPSGRPGRFGTVFVALAAVGVMVASGPEQERRGELLN